MLWRVSQSLGENRFDEECGDEMEGNEVIGVSLRSKPEKLWDDRNDEVFGYYDVCEAYDSSKEVVYVKRSCVSSMRNRHIGELKKWRIVSRREKSFVLNPRGISCDTA